MSLPEPLPQRTLTLCPRCGERRLKISAIIETTAYVLFRGTDDPDVYDTKGQDIDWDEDSDASCTNCGYGGQVRDFCLSDTPRPVDVARVQKLAELEEDHLEEGAAAFIARLNPQGQSPFLLSDDALLLAIQTRRGAASGEQHG